ncbi:hypothetical protein [Agromyces subbeticus]|uniref:hypothetical protein n=1 Tax=Agromyces subbeticus TaxID=293890 RepID=UPI0003B776E9|nr:hypothetical protein [Agromyces subbeticus]
MSRCSSWRFVAGAGHDSSHRPGGCRTCWVPCRERVEPGREQCDGCLAALVMHPEAEIRLTLAESTGVDRASLETLATDLDLRVSLAAQRALDDLDPEVTSDEDVFDAAKPALPFSAPTAETDWLTEETDR